MEFSAFNLLDVEIHPFTIKQFHRLMADAIHSERKVIIASQNLHSVYLYHKNKNMRTLHQMAYKRIDGMPLILWGRLLGLPLRKEQRVTWVDWIHPLMHEAAEKRWKVFYLGSKRDVALRGIQHLKEKHPGLRIECTDGYFDTAPDCSQNRAKLKLIRKAHPDILVVGMGMPRQEKWVLDNFPHISAKVILTCGAAMEYVAGEVGNPPRWMGTMGLEWVYRLMGNPGRFWRRYLVEPWSLLPLFVKDAIHRKDCRRVKPYKPLVRATGKRPMNSVLRLRIRKQA